MLVSEEPVTAEHCTVRVFWVLMQLTSNARLCAVMVPNDANQSCVQRQVALQHTKFTVAWLHLQVCRKLWQTEMQFRPQLHVYPNYMSYNLLCTVMDADNLKLGHSWRTRAGVVKRGVRVKCRSCCTFEQRNSQSVAVMPGCTYNHNACASKRAGYRCAEPVCVCLKDGTVTTPYLKKKKKKFYMLRPVNKTDHMQQGMNVLA